MTGVFDRTSDTLGTLSVWVGSGEEFEVVTVGCQIDDTQVDAAAALSKGDPVTVQGVNTGFDGLSVTLKDCVLK